MRAVAEKRRLRVITDLPGPASQALREQEQAHLGARHTGHCIVRRGGHRIWIRERSARRRWQSFPRFVSGHLRRIDRLRAPWLPPRAQRTARSGSCELVHHARSGACSKRHHRAHPAGLDRVQLFSGGAEAVESAIRLARAHTGKFEVLSFWGGFHGKTSGVLAQMGSEFKQGLGPMSPGAHLTPYADCARCPFKLQHPSCGLLCVEFARDKLKKETTGRLAAILVEPMQGTAGNIIPPATGSPQSPRSLANTERYSSPTR